MKSIDSTTAIAALALPYEKLSPGRLFFAHLSKRWWIYLVGALAVIVTNITEILVPKCVQWSIDLARGGAIPELFRGSDARESFEYVFIALCFIFVAQALSRRYWRLTLGIESMRVGATLRSALWERSLLYPEDVLQKEYSVGAVMNLSTSDVNASRASFGWTLVGLTDLIFLAVFCFGAMCSIDWRLTLMIFSLLPFFAWGLRRNQLREYRAHTAAQEALSLLNEMCSQAISTVKLQKVTGTGDFWIKRLLAAAAIYRDKRFAVVVTALRFLLIMGVFPLLAYVAVFILGIEAVQSGSMSLGEFVAFQSYVLILQGPLAEMGYILADWQRAMASLARIINALRVQPAEGLLPSIEQRDIVKELRESTDLIYNVENLCFHYPGADRLLFRALCFSVARFEKLGIVGPIGTGKSTIVKILGGLERRYRGQVSLLGHDIRSYSHAALCNEVGTVSQKPFLFANSIRDNMRLNRELSDDQIWYFLEICQIAHEINKLPKKLDSMLGEWGINLSGGQKQRLTLARTIARAPTILLLDDCLSAVDAITEEKILTALEDEIKNLSIVWVAHRESSLRLVSRTIELTL